MRDPPCIGELADKDVARQGLRSHCDLGVRIASVNGGDAPNEAARLVGRGRRDLDRLISSTAPGGNRFGRATPGGILVDTPFVWEIASDEESKAEPDVTRNLCCLRHGLVPAMALERGAIGTSNFR